MPGASRRQTLLSALVAAALLFALAVDLRPEARVRRAIALHLRGGSPSEWMRDLDRIDRTFRERIPDGDVLLRFEGFDPDSPADAQFVSRHYFRSRYAAFPRRVYVGTAPEPIRGAAEILASPEPDPEWLDAHGVVHRMSVAKSGRRRVTRFERIAP